MCGIFALLNKQSNDFFNKSLIQKGFMEGKGRGPENTQEKWIDNDDIMLGFHRLAINGLDSISNQPIEIDGITLICNGEIYNYKELFEELNIVPHTNSDCEIIIHLYKKYGIHETLHLLDGVFAFLLLDNNDLELGRKVYVARDPFGVRPLYIMKYSHNMYELRKKSSLQKNKKNTVYGFSSEPYPLQELYNTKYENGRYQSNDKSLTQFKPGTYSKFVLPWTCQSSWELHTEEHSYYSLKVDKISLVTSGIPDQRLLSNLYESLSDAVYKRVLNTERPIACLLSGGLDSSLITALVCKHVATVNKCRSKENQIQIETYSIGLDGSEDLKYASIVAKHLQTKHNEIVVSEEDFFGSIPKVIKAIGSYDTTTVRASVGNYLVGKYISEHSDCKVIFNGDGSDEVMGGYMYFHKAPNAIEFDNECKRLVSNIHYFDGLRSDRCISCHGLEPRTPFLDYSFVKHYLSIDRKLRFNTTHEKCEKYLLRYAVDTCDNDLLPKTILWRTKEAFSDGVSNQKKSWYEIIQERVVELNRNEDHSLSRFVDKVDYNEVVGIWNQPTTNEQIYYRTIFNYYYPNMEKMIPYFWMPRFVEASDASARTLDIYKNKMNMVDDTKGEETVEVDIDKIIESGLHQEWLV